MEEKPRFYILHGEDEYSRKDFLHQLRAEISDPSQLNITVIDGTQTTIPIIMNTARSYPFLADTRLVIVEGMLAHLGERKASQDHLAILAEELINLPEFTRLIFHEPKEISAKNPIIILAKNNRYGQEINFANPKDLARWISQHAKKVYQVNMEPSAARALALVVGKNLRIADSEVAKLAAYVNFERSITEADVAAMTPYVVEAVIFDMVDALGKRDGAKAMRLSQALVEQGNDMLGMLGMISRQYRLLILAKEYLMEGGNPSLLGQVMGINSSYVTQKITSQTREFADISSLEAIYRYLVEIDLDIKQGKINKEMALPLFIATVTG